MRHTTSALALTALAASALLSACATNEYAASEPSTLSDDALRTLPAYDGNTGRRLEWSTITQQLAQADAVLIGEVHGHPVGLPGAAVLFDDAVGAQPFFNDLEPDEGAASVAIDPIIRPRPGALAVEFWERDEQPDIDAYLKGEITRDQLAQGKGSGYPPGHERMLETAKSAGWPVVAANAPRAFVRLARTEGYDHLRETLSEEQMRLLVIPDELDDGPYRDRFFALMGGMTGHTEDTESDEPDPVVLSFFRAQQVWDATMADSVTTLVNDRRHPTFLVIGRFHTDHEGSTLVRVREALPNARVLSVTFANRELGLLGLHPEDRGMADIVIYTGEGAP